jgi:signal transduction histidine kinase
MAKPPAPREHFEVDSALLSEIGEKLVTTPHVALAELVKNAYDADATEVFVTIGQNGTKPNVVVRDDGHGMTRPAVHQYWMRIGTTNKEEDQLSPAYGRRRTGAKGIGRFACRRLGRILELETTAELAPNDRPEKNEKYEKTHLLFEWDKFVPGTTVSSIDVEARTEYLSKAQTGLRLSMSRAKSDEWSYRGYAYLKRQLAALCANRGAKRKGFKEDPGFRVFLTAPGLQDEGETTDLREQLMNAGWGTLEASIDDEGRAVCTLVGKGVGKRKLRSSRVFEGLTDVHLRLAIFPFEREWLRDISVVSKGSVSELCNDWGGVQVRFRGFRIYPYGDLGDDWLDIESDRARRLGKPGDDDVFDYARVLDGVDASRSLLNMLSMKSFVGSVEIGLTQEGLEPKADRMGFVDGKVFRELKHFARFAIDWSMVLRDYAVQLAAEKKRRHLRDKIETEYGQKLPPDGAPEETVRAMRSALGKLAHNLPAARQKEVRFVEDLTSYLESTISLTSRDLLRLRLVASASTLTLLFAHEIKSLASTFASIAQEVKEIASLVPARNRPRIEQLGQEVRESHRNLAELLALTNSMGVLDSRSQPVHIDLRKIANRAIARFDRIRERYTISIDAKQIPEGLLVGPMLEGELFAIVINVLSNSIKAVIAAGGERRISLCAARHPKHIQLEIQDSGLGVSPEHFEDVFTPMISDPAGTLYSELGRRLNPEDSLLLGGGTGLGLSIVRGILQARHGSVDLVQPDGDWKFHLRLKLPT